MKGNQLSYPDPFGSAPADEPAEEAQQETAPSEPVAKPRPVVTEADGKVVLTFKGGRDFDAPWIVIHAASLEDAYEQLTTKGDLLGKVMERTANAGAHFSGGSKPAAKPAQSGGGQQRQSKAPQQAQEAPGGEKRYCEHGEMEFKSGVSKAGNAYQLFSCTAPRSEQCPAQYLNKRK
ncbi:hypothetical protein SEA_GAUGELDP_48 [Mycobacterium phage GaugeLDP]|nr:hypothetical protein SEA_GAUGELDP_48 [Mycobacterium phage GaugeLDP]